SYQSTYDSAFSAALAGSQGKATTPSPSIAGIKEAHLVADWSRRRARGEKVTREPPTLERPQILASEQVAPPTTATVVPTAAPIPAPQPIPQAQPEAVAQDAAPAAPAQTSVRKRLLGMFGG